MARVGIDGQLFVETSLQETNFIDEPFQVTLESSDGSEPALTVW